MRTPGGAALGAVVLGGLLIASASGAAMPPGPQPSPSMAPPSAYPSPVASGPGAQAVDCATIPRYGTGLLPADTPGDLVPIGATTVTLCDTSYVTPPPTGLAQPEVLTEPRAVASFAQLLNALPAAETDQACLRIAFQDQVSFVFTFDPALRRPNLVVVVDRNCGVLTTTTGGFTTRARSYASLDPMPVFQELVRNQP